MKTNFTECLLAISFVASAICQGAEIRLEASGARFGFSSQARSQSFRQAEAFVDFDLPWRLALGSDWHMQTRADLSAGELWGNDEGGFIGTVGPFVSIGRERFPVSLELGVSPTMLSRDVYNNVNFGMTFQFTCYGGVLVAVLPHLQLGYRFQHMSNAGFAPSNPGLNLNMFTVGYSF